MHGAIKKNLLSSHPRWGAADAEIKVTFVENTELEDSTFKGQYIAINATLTAIDFFLANFYLPVHSPAFFQNPSRVFPVLAAANTDSCVDSQNEKGHPAGCRFPCRVPADYK